MKSKLIACILVLCLLTGAVSATFTDISDRDTALAAATLESMGILSGTGGAAFSPNATLTRAQFCTMMIRAMDLEESTGAQRYKTMFLDVKGGLWYTGYINLAFQKGIVNGYGNGRFGPTDTVTYAQFVTAALRVLGYTTAETGSVWPTDYVNFAAETGLSEGLSLGANDPVTRGNAARILYNMVRCKPNGSTKYFYESFGETSSTKEAVILDNNAAYGSGSGYLYACTITTTQSSTQSNTQSSAQPSGSTQTTATQSTATQTTGTTKKSELSWLNQKRTLSDTLVGYWGTLLLDSAGKSVGFIPESNQVLDLTVSSVKASGITDTGGKTHAVGSAALLIAGGNTYTYGSNGYLQLSSGKHVRLFYDSEGAVSYVYLLTGTSGSGQTVAVAATRSAATELPRALGISGSGYKVLKNGVEAKTADLGQYDVAYYDAASNTLCVSDHRISGVLEGASPNLDAPETVTVAGCAVDVLECAWNSLEAFAVGDKVTALLTDDNKAAAFYAAQDVPTEMVGVLSTDGRSVTLSGSGLKLAPDTIDADEKLYGSLVHVTSLMKEVICSSLPTSSAKLELSAGTIGSNAVAPGCCIYEWEGSGNVYSLSGEQGTWSSDFSDIVWTGSLSPSYVSYYHLNSAGQADVILLRNATGNYYQFGKLAYYSGENGIYLGGSGNISAYNTAVTLTNGGGTSAKHLCTLSSGGTYAGIALKKYDGASYSIVTAVSSLSAVRSVKTTAFVLDGDEWSVQVNDYEIPVYSGVQIYYESLNRWAEGKDAVAGLLTSGLELSVYYDRTETTGAQIRIIVAN